MFHKRIEGKIGITSLEGGIAYARLFGFNINENINSINYKTFTALQDEFTKDELVLIIGGGIFINERIRVTGRFAYSLTLLYEDENPSEILTGRNPNINHLRNLQLAIGINYIFR